MSKRITLTADDAILIAAALEVLHKSSIVNESVYYRYGIASRQRIGQIKEKLNCLLPKEKEGSKDKAV